MTTRIFFALAFMLSAVIGCVSPVVAAPGQGVSEDTIAARERFFGAENVDAVSGQVRADRVIFSWVTNASLAVSIRGRIVLLDTYINRPELLPAGADLRRSPISVQELVALAPEAIFLGHGHGDHADNAAYIAKLLNIPIYSSPETCDAMQADVQRMFNDPNAVNGGVKIIPDSLPVKCISPISRGSQPGAEVVNIHQLDPVACIVAFKHIHSGTVPTDTTFPFIPVFADMDPRELSSGAGVPPNFSPPSPPNSPPLYPRLTSLTPPTPPTGAVPGQMNLRTTGVGTGGPISIFYQFILGDANNFTFVWHNTTGPLKEGAGSDPGLPSAAIGAKLFAIMDSLPQTDVEFGSIVSLGAPTNGVRDPILYHQHIKPLVYIPIHETDATPISSSLRYKNAYLQAVVAANVAVRPEIRWMVDPDDFVRPMVYDPKDDRWQKSKNQQTINKFCNH